MLIRDWPRPGISGSVFSSSAARAWSLVPDWAWEASGDGASLSESAPTAGCWGSGCDWEIGRSASEWYTRTRRERGAPKRHDFSLPRDSLFCGPWWPNFEIYLMHLSSSNFSHSRCISHFQFQVSKLAHLSLVSAWISLCHQTLKSYRAVDFLRRNKKASCRTRPTLIFETKPGKFLLN